MTNAANHERDHAWLAGHADGFDVSVEDVAADYAMLALQGPRARDILGRHLDGEAPARMRIAGPASPASTAWWRAPDTRARTAWSC